MTLRLNGSTSGYTEIDAPAVAGSNTLRLPTGNGSDGNILGTDGAGNLSWVNGRMVLATAQNTTSGTSIDFTGIPSWVKRVTVMLNDVSTNGSSEVVARLGTSGGVVNTGYSSLRMLFSDSSTTTGATVTSGFPWGNPGVSYSLRGMISIVNISGNVWLANGTNTNSVGYGIVTSGNVTLSGTLDRLRLTTVNGTDTFDAGSINILYEG
jgi:hypothetical protein